MFPLSATALATLLATTTVARFRVRWRASDVVAPIDFAAAMASRGTGCAQCAIRVARSSLPARSCEVAGVVNRSLLLCKQASEQPF